MSDTKRTSPYAVRLRRAEWTADIAMKILRQIADRPRNTREKVLASSAVTFIEQMLAAKRKERIHAFRPLTFAECSDAEAIMEIARQALAAAPGEGVEQKRTERMLHDYPKLLQFFERHALGSKMPPSCLGCGQDKPFSTKHMDLPDIGLCADCVAAIRASPKGHPMFRDHDCAYCGNGEKPCRQNNPNQCEYPHARND